MTHDYHSFRGRKYSIHVYGSPSLKYTGSSMVSLIRMTSVEGSYTPGNDVLCVNNDEVVSSLISYSQH